MHPIAGELLRRELEPVVGELLRMGVGAVIVLCVAVTATCLLTGLVSLRTAWRERRAAGSTQTAERRPGFESRRTASRVQRQHTANTLRFPVPARR